MSGDDVALASSRGGVARARLLDAAIEVMAEGCATCWTLRGLADRLGTSHRMIIYHFGSREGLLLEVVSEIERRQRDRSTALVRDFDDPADAARALWRELSDPALAAYERLFFELYVAGLQGHEYANPLLKTAVGDWLEPLTEAFARATGDREQAPVDARLGLAVIRGLLLDQLATGDREAALAAHERYLRFYFA